jgi:hypothetical protein
MNAPDEPGGLSPPEGDGPVGRMPPDLPGPERPRPEYPQYDRWAHRRGEPRVFALLWTIYLMLASGLALASIGVRGRVAVDVYRPIAQVLVVTVASGIVLVWPLVRLSQARPRRSGAWAAMMDYFVVILPVQAIVWPQTWLTAWPLDVVGALSVMLASWGLLVAGMLAWALGPGTGLEERTRVAGSAVWMGGWVVLVGAGPVLGELPGLIPPGWAALASPLTAVHALTADLPVGSLGRTVAAGQWSMMVLPGVLGGVGWLAAWLREVAGSFRIDR